MGMKRGWFQAAELCVLEYEVACSHGCTTKTGVAQLWFSFAMQAVCNISFVVFRRGGSASAGSELAQGRKSLHPTKTITVTADHQEVAKVILELIPH